MSLHTIVYCTWITSVTLAKHPLIAAVTSWTQTARPPRGLHPPTPMRTCDPTGCSTTTSDRIYAMMTQMMRRPMAMRAAEAVRPAVADAAERPKGVAWPVPCSVQPSLRRSRSAARAIRPSSPLAQKASRRQTRRRTKRRSDSSGWQRPMFVDPTIRGTRPRKQKTWPPPRRARIGPRERTRATYRRCRAAPRWARARATDRAIGRAKEPANVKSKKTSQRVSGIYIGL